MKNLPKHVLITGASSGLGEALAKNLAQQGINLTLCARREDRLQALKSELIKNTKSEILILPADVSSKISCEQLIEKSVAHFNGLDVFIANAGLGMWSRFRDIADPDQLRDLMQINYMGMVYGLFYALPYLRKSHGSMIAISSVQGAMPVVYHTGYVASKYAVNGFIETLRLEEPDVHFLLAMPAWIGGTELRSHALTGDAKTSIQVKKSHGQKVVSAKECAELILAALMAKKERLFIPQAYRYLPFVRNLMTTSFDRFVTKKVKGQLESE